MKLISLIFMFTILTNISAYGMGSKSVDEEKKEDSNQAKAVNQKKTSPTRPVQAKKKSYIVIKGPTLKKRETFKRVEILKIAMDEIIKTGNFEIIFTAPESWRDAKVDFFELIMEGEGTRWGRDKEGYNLSFYLVNGRSGKIKAQAIKERILDRRLLYTTRVMLFELFYGKELAQKKIAQLPKDAPEDKPNDEKKADAEKSNVPKPSKPPIPNVQKSPPEDKEKKKNELKARVTPQKPKQEYQFNKPGMKKEPGIPPPPNEEEEKPEKPESPESPSSKSSSPGESGEKSGEEKSGKKDKAEENPSPEALSKEIEKEIEKLKEQYKKNKKDILEEIAREEEKEKEKEKDEDKEVVNDAALGSDNGELAPKTPGSGEALKTIKKYYVKGFVMIQEIQSKDLVETVNNIKQAGVDLVARLQFDPKSYDHLAINVFFGTVIDSDEQYSLSGTKKLGVIYQKTFGEFFFRPIFGFEYETQSFVNLASIGQGLKVFSSKIFWYLAGAEMHFNIYNKNIFFGAYLANSFVGTTDFGPDDKSRSMEGTKTHYYMGFDTTLGFSVELHRQTAKMSSSGLTTLSNQELSSWVSLVYQM